MKKKLAMIILLCIVVTAAFTGCVLNNKADEKMITLTERQKEILREQGFPDEYDKLDDYQKDVIIKIEDALCYLEDKYDEKFEYDGYIAPDLYDDECVMASIVDSYPAKIITVTFDYDDNKDYIFSDDYRERMAEDEYAAEVSKWLSQYIDEDQFMMKAEVFELKKGNNILERAITHVHISLNNCPEELVKTIATDYLKYMSAYTDSAAAMFCVYDSETFAEIEEYNYDSYLNKYMYEYDARWDGKDKSVKKGE